MTKHGLWILIFCLLGLGCLGQKKKRGELGAFEAISRGYLPQTGMHTGLQQLGKLRNRQGPDDMIKFLGKTGRMYAAYGATSLQSADYYLGDPNKTMTLESIDMGSIESAAALFYYYKGRWLRDQGKSIDVGSDGVLDTTRGNRNLYFYKRKRFFKVIYTGKLPAPNLIPVAKTIEKIVPGKNTRPRGFEYCHMDGIKADSARVSPGYTFRCDFLPPAVYANAPAAGKNAEIFFIYHNG